MQEAAGRGRQSCDVGLPVMAVTRRGGEEGVCAFPLSEWLGGGRSWNGSPYKITLCCFLRSALLRRAGCADSAGRERERTSGERKRKRNLHDRETERAGKQLGRTPRIV
ncbi:UNVERIFIED_CONTAM: hypothetical protein FKN15_052233 [Acipenser sinensis]